MHLASRVSSTLEVDRREFESRVIDEAAWLKAAVRDGTFDNTQAIVGLEYEFYGVRSPDDGPADPDRPAGTEEECSLVRLPRGLLDLIGFEKELGLHNAEMQTSPQPLNGHGLASQQEEVKARLQAALSHTLAEGVRLVSDGMWTIPPAGESAGSYLTDSVDDQGVTIATNMSGSIRYHAMANADYPAGMCLEAPGVHLEAETVMPESLITSIQPHYQVAHAPDLPRHFRYALRVAGPLLALGVNSPFFPPDLYDDPDPGAVLEEGHAENRIAVFESVLNPADATGKVRFPPDIGDIEEAIDQIAMDETIVPMLHEAGDRFDDRFAHFRHTHGSYWRWVRPVFDGETRSAANARIEFRPLPAQPTVPDSISFLALYAGVLEGLTREGHPVADLDHADAERNFYAAAHDGLEADLRWIDAEGSRTTDSDRLYADLFEHASAGLAARGLSAADIDQYLAPLKGRVTRGTTPASWKQAEVRRRLDDGASLETAIYATQREYVRRQASTLLDGTFLDWLPPAG